MTDKEHTSGSDELSDETIDSLEAFTSEFKRVNIVQERETHKRFKPLYEKRQALISRIPNFWPKVFKNHHILDRALQHRDDIVAMSCLTDLVITRDEVEPRAFTAEFHFSENPYFSDKSIKKVYKYEPSPKEGSSKLPSTDRSEEGVSEAELAFDWNEDIDPQATKIHWKSDAKNLCKLFPRLKQEDDLEDIVEAGSFFNYFENAGDPDDFGHVLEEDVYPKAVQYFLGRGENMALDPDAESETDEEDDGDDGSVDLEERPKKKVKTS